MQNKPGVLGAMLVGLIVVLAAAFWWQGRELREMKRELRDAGEQQFRQTIQAFDSTTRALKDSVKLIEGKIQHVKGEARDVAARVRNTRDVDSLLVLYYRTRPSAASRWLDGSD